MNSVWNSLLEWLAGFLPQALIALAGFYSRKIFSAGENIQIHGREGVLAGITPVHTFVDEDGQVITIPNSVFLEEVVRQ